MEKAHTALSHVSYKMALLEVNTKVQKEQLQNSQVAINYLRSEQKTLNSDSIILFSSTQS